MSYVAGRPVQRTIRRGRERRHGRPPSGLRLPWPPRPFRAPAQGCSPATRTTILSTASAAVPPTAGAPVVAAIPAATRMGAVHLTVADLDRSVGYYERALGLRAREREDGRVALGTGGEDLLVLHEQPGARSARSYCGLYHFALLLPERVDLARWLAHAARERVPLVGLSDHYVSEAIYLSDPDDHGIEIYWDRPREVWEGAVAERLTTLPLDTAG